MQQNRTVTYCRTSPKDSSENLNSISLNYRWSFRSSFSFGREKKADSILLSWSNNNDLLSFLNRTCASFREPFLLTFICSASIHLFSWIVRIPTNSALPGVAEVCNTMNDQESRFQVAYRNLFTSFHEQFKHIIYHFWKHIAFISS